MLRFTRALLVTLNLLNWLASLFFVGIIVLLVSRQSWIEARLLARHASHVALARDLEIAAMILGLATVLCTHVVFVRLIAIIDAVIAERPFAIANARRLRDIAWALLGIQLLDTAFGGIAIMLSRAMNVPAPWTPGLTGWLAVLLLFVLARIFGRGATMQDEIEATV